MNTPPNGQLSVPHSLYLKVAVSWLAVALLCGGCTLPRKPASATRDRAFITYWPPAENSAKPRLAVKDLIDLKGEVTTAGSEFLLKTSPPADRDAACLAIARATGVQFVGKTNTTEFAVAASGINEYFGTPRNPMAPGRIPGGSSSGSAAAVGSGDADIAFGTDTAGSVRIPAACCGVVGLKTTLGLVPLDGVYPIAPTKLDTVGPLARDIEWTARGMELLQAGFGARYQRAVAATSSGRSLRVGRLRLRGTAPEIDRAVDDALAAAGFEVVELGETFRDEWRARRPTPSPSSP
jgi:amidase